MLGGDADFVPCFCMVFTLLGAKVLFGEKQVTLGSVLLLACMSSAAATAWVGGSGTLVSARVARAMNSSHVALAGEAASRAFSFLSDFFGEKTQDEL